MRRLLVIAIALGFLVLQHGPDIYAQNDVDPVFDGPARVLWQARYDGPMSGIDRVTSMAVSPDGSIVFVVGETYGPRYNMDYITLAYDVQRGRPLWDATYDSIWSKNDTAMEVLVSPDGMTVFVSGTSIGSGADGGVGDGLGDADWDFVTLAYDSLTGEQLWERRFHGHQRGDGWTESMAIAPDGGTLLLNGRSDCMDDRETELPEPGNTTLAYDVLTGNEVWRACFGASLSHGDFGTRLAVATDSETVFAVGTHQNGETGYDYATLAYDARTGARLWMSHYDNGLHDPDAFPQIPIALATDPTFDSPRAIAVGANERVIYVTGESRGHYGLVDYVTVAYDVQTGRQVGEARFDGDLQGHDRAFDLAVSPDGGAVFVTGESETTGDGREVVTIAYDPTLRNVLWTARHNETPGVSQDAGRRVRVSPDAKTVYVGGDSWGANSLDWIVMAYSAATGKPLWTGCYDGVISHADFGRDLAVSPDSRTVFVTGHSCSCGVSGFDITTMAITTGLLPAQRGRRHESRPDRAGSWLRAPAFRH
jgi:hypothetical protein